MNLSRKCILQIMVIAIILSALLISLFSNYRLVKSQQELTHTLYHQVFLELVKEVKVDTIKNMPLAELSFINTSSPILDQLNFLLPWGDEELKLIMSEYYKTGEDLRKIYRLRYRGEAVPEELYEEIKRFNAWYEKGEW